jgi:anti-anti-sigma factor
MMPPLGPVFRPGSGLASVERRRLAAGAGHEEFPLTFGPVPPLSAETTWADAKLVVRLAGELRRASLPQVRRILAKCLAEQPKTLVVDLAGVQVRDELALTVFATAARQAETWPGASLMLSIPDPAVARLFATGGYGRLPMFASVDEALAADPGRGTPSLGDVLLPASGAARHARGLAVEACERWGLPAIAPAAAIVTGELVANAVVHARTMMDLRLSRGHHYFLIAVRDGSDAPPRLLLGPRAEPVSGRGLLLVDEFAPRWGSFPAAGGKVVWAALSVRGR